MAFSIKVTGISKRTGQPEFEIAPNWWDEEQLRDDRRFIETNKTGSYRDYDADLSLKEIREMHESFRKEATSGVYELDEWQEIIQPELKEFDEALYSQTDKFSHFHVKVFEWESGLC